jgi:hypothetical protein
VDGGGGAESCVCAVRGYDSRRNGRQDMNKEDEKRCDICEISYFERNNYYYGKLMTVRDYFDEQCYFNEKRWLINRAVHGWGVVCGLEVYESEGKVFVSPGLAIDCCGREILVCKDKEVELIPTKDKCQGNDDPAKEKEFYIGLEFWACKTEEVQIAPAACGEAEKCEFNRIRDYFEIRVLSPSEVIVDYPPGLCPLTEKEAKDLQLYICEKTIKCSPECPELPRNHAVILAKVTLDEEGNGIIIEDCPRFRRQVYSNKTLFDLINCYHGDLPHVIAVNWERAEEINGVTIGWEDFIGYLFCWDDVPKNESECERLRRFLKDDLDIKWAEEATINKSQDGMTINISEGKNLAEITIDEENKKDGSTLELKVKEESGKRNIHKECIYDQGVKVKFDRKMKAGTINANTFLFLVKMNVRETGNYRYEQVPGVVSYAYEESTGESTATFKFTPEWIQDVYYGYSRIREEPGDFMVVLKADFILSDEYLFNIDAAEFEDSFPNIGNGILISKELKEKFGTEGFPISGNAMVTKEDEDKWRINDEEKVYIVKKEGEIYLNIYREENGKPTRALDGNFIGGKLPSGNGTQGGDFVSWFSVEPKPEEEKIIK